MNFLLIISLALLLEICPNPYGSDDAEYLKVYCPDSCILSDGEASLMLEDGFYTIAKNSSAFLEKFEPLGQLIEFPKNFELSNNGEEICMSSKEPRDFFYYGEDIRILDSGVVYYRKGEKWDFRYEEWSNFECVSEHLKGRLIITPADFKAEGFKIVSYSFFANFEPEELFVDPKAGVRCGVNASFLSGPYRHFHYKFGIRGEMVIITTENWVFSKKGYIVQFESQKMAETLSYLIEYDRRFASEAKSCSGNAVEKRFGDGKSIEFEANATLIILPDCNPILELIRSANKRLYIIAPYMGFDWFDDRGLLHAIRSAKENGTKVTVVLSEEYSGAEAEILKKEGIEVKKISKLHGKAIVADDKVLITSANMNKYGLKLNREIGILIESPEVAEFILKDIEGRRFEFWAVLVPFALFALTIYLLWKFRP
jgi:cardiolipin synthase